MRSHVITFVVIVAAIFVGLFVYDEFRAKRPVDDFGVGKAHAPSSSFRAISRARLIQRARQLLSTTSTPASGQQITKKPAARTRRVPGRFSEEPNG
jgi:hypothetical protein